MQMLRKEWDKITVVLLMILYVTVLGFLSIARHNAFASGFDLANMDQTIWNTLHGRFFQLSADTGTVSRFAIHADLILVLLSPLYLIWSDPRMLLLVAESMFIASASVPIYLISRKVTGDRLVGVLMAALYLVLPGVQWTDIYDFHGVSLAMPFLLFAFYFMLEKKWLPYWIFIGLALSTKEQISLSVALLGLITALVYKERKVGLWTACIGSAWFIAAVFIVIPHFSPGSGHWAWSWYQMSWSGGQSGRLISIKNIFSTFILDSQAWSYYNMLLKQFGYLPLFGGPWLIMILPELTVNMLSSQGQMRSIWFHYDSGVTPWLIVASIYGLNFWSSVFKRLNRTERFAKLSVYAVVLSALTVALRVNYHYGPLPITPSCWCQIYKATDGDRRFEEVLKKIPASASVTASPEVRPHLTHREHAYTLPVATESADFIAIIDQNRMVGDYNPKDYELRLVKELDASGKYIRVFQEGHFLLYKKSHIQ